MKVHDERLHAFAAFLVPRRAIAARNPEAAALPAPGSIIDAALETLGIETQRIGNAQRHELIVNQRVHPIKQIARRDGHVRAQPQRVVLIDPGVMR